MKYNKRQTLKLFLMAGCAALGMSTAWAQNTNSTQLPQVKINTSAGDIVLELYPEKAPKTVNNFLQYVDEKYYEGTVFHRVINNFMIQGGGFNADMKEKPTRAPIVLESNNGLQNIRGTIAMARTNVPNSAASQFFINVRDNNSLDGKSNTTGYAVFGKVIQGMDIVDKIKIVPTGRKGMHSDVPIESITIQKVTYINQ